MNQLSSIRLKYWVVLLSDKILPAYQHLKALIHRFGYILLLVFSAVLGISLQVYLRQIDPLSAIIDSSIWVVVCYTLCSLLIYHLVSLQISKLLLKIAKSYTIKTLKSESWHLLFLGAYFLVLYGFLFCLSLWL